MHNNIIIDIYILVRIDSISCHQSTMSRLLTLRLKLQFSNATLSGRCL